MRRRRQVRIHNHDKIENIILSSPNGAHIKLKSLNLLGEVILMTSFLDSAYDNISWGQRFWHIVNKNRGVVKCHICNKYPARYNRNQKYITCGQKCQDISANINKKITSIKLFGVDNFSKTKEFKDKTKNISIERYEVDNYAKTEESKAKSKETCIKKYNSEHYQQTIEFTNKVRNRWFKKFNKEGYLLLEIQSKNYVLTHEECKTSFKIKKSTFCSRVKNDVEICILCNPLCLGTPSKGELELAEFIKNIYDGNISRNNRDIVSPLEIDIYLPDINLAIEYNGYYHTKPEVIKRDKKKKKLCKKMGISLLIIQEEKWKNDREFTEKLVLDTVMKLS